MPDTDLTIRDNVLPMLSPSEVV
ncbi:hypothetical protein LCGC14_2402810, partial [marine sediment metagenome]